MQDSCNNSIAILRYDYIEGNHQPPNLRAIVDVIKNLNRIHTKGFVHGDIRVTNIVYGYNSGTIIDCDFAAPEGSKYPDYYSADVPERAKGATRHAVMRKHHDRVSLYWSILASYIYLTSCQRSKIEELIVKTVRLQTIITELMQDVNYE